VSTAGQGNNCFINALYGRWSKHPYPALRAQNPENYRRQLKKLLRRWLIKIQMMPTEEFKKLAENYDKFRNFTGGLDENHPGCVHDINKEGLMCELLEQIVHNLKDEISIDFSLIYWIAKEENFRVNAYRELDGSIKSYNLNLELNESEIYSFKLSSEGDGQYGHYTRVMELKIEDERFKKLIKKYLQQNKFIGGENTSEQVQLFFGDLRENQKKMPLLKLALIQTQQEWDSK
jgi:hypothetical protein